MLPSLRKQQLVHFAKPFSNQSIQSLRFSTKVSNEPTPNDAAVGTEDVLVAHTDPFGMIGTKINPAILRAFKESRSLKTNNKKFENILKSAEKVLLSMNKTVGRANLEIMRVSYAPSLVRFAGARENNDIQFGRLTTEAEFKGIASFLAINMPRFFPLWNEFDKVIADRILTTSSIELGLLASFAIKTAKNQFGEMQLSLLTPQALLQHLSKYKMKHPDRNVFEELTALSMGEDSFTCFAPIGAPTVRDNKALELLGLQLHLFAHNAYILDQLSNKKALLGDLSTQTQRILSTLPTPVKLHTLRWLWESIPLIHLPDSYIIYVQLYKQILFSLNTESLQIVHHEEMIASLFDSMVQSKFKSSKLIDRLFECISSRGMNYAAIGFRVFNALTQLENIPFAIMILENTLSAKPLKMEQSFAQMNGRRLTSFSDTSKKEIAHYLRNSLHAAPSTITSSFLSVATTTSFSTNSTSTSSASSSSEGIAVDNSHTNTATAAVNTNTASTASTAAPGAAAVAKRKISECILALMCFNYESNKAYTSLLHTLEVNLLSHLPQATLHDLITLLNSYALAGRLSLPLFEVIDALLATKYLLSPHPEEECPVQHHVLDIKQCALLIWVCARLNHAPAYLPVLIMQFFAQSNKQASRKKTLSTGHAFVLSRTLWSLAVLQRLDVATYLAQEERLLLGATTLFQGVQLQMWLYSQLSQIRCELALQLQHSTGPPAPLSTLSAPLSGTGTPSQQTGPAFAQYPELGHLNALLIDFMQWKNAYKKQQIRDEKMSSFTHLEASALLSSMGIAHENEKLLVNGYLVDIFIPMTSNSQSSQSSHSTSSNSHRSSGYSSNVTGAAVGGAEDEGIVLEFDGPFHFESYLKQPMGSTLMKRRHIESLGYHIVSIPYTQFRPELPRPEKSRILQDIVDQAVRTFHANANASPQSQQTPSPSSSHYPHPLSVQR